ncbi:PREDICTED: spermatogenesis-associated protein 7-like isoform X2 [Branchiostoma belcheri]|uniref:Spermatogenesis-associated protein 7-like isoform X2 n=1 Tax=Branchiostoma belcheri TaxID=7741 RepID=A0A6P4YT72_BRABE|nr:PREDICTED: spermatogenesis-associated protein 7-like isoform X2 [Branchiostoma belcheri]
MAGRPKSRGSPAPPGVMASPFKGHLVLKSSPFAPSTNKITEQYMIQDHLSVHYKKLSTAKPAIDNRVPASMVKSVKYRDQQRRLMLEKEMKKFQRELKSARSASRMSSRPNTPMKAQHPEQDLSASDLDLLENILEDRHRSPSHYRNPNIVPSNIPPQPRPRRPRSAQPQYPEDLETAVDIAQEVASPAPARPRSAYSARSARSRTGSVPMATTRGTTNAADQSKVNQLPRNTPDGDILNTRAHKFRSPDRPFTPRTLNRTGVQSRLAQSKCYNAPRRKKPPKPADNDGRQSVASDLNMSELSYTDVPPQPAPRASRQEEQSRVPPLDIEKDADHARWVEEQAKRMERLTVKEDSWSTVPQPAERRMSDTNRSMYREEELKYLEFVTDVTNDILARGIFTNKVLLQVFDSHVQKRRGELNETRMHQMIDILREDLGIADDSKAPDTRYTLRPRPDDDEDTLGDQPATMGSDTFGPEDVSREYENILNKQATGGGLDDTDTLPKAAEDASEVRTENGHAEEDDRHAPAGSPLSLSEDEDDSKGSEDEDGKKGEDERKERRDSTSSPTLSSTSTSEKSLSASMS